MARILPKKASKLMKTVEVKVDPPKRDKLAHRNLNKMMGTVNKQDREFLDEWLKVGSATDAYMKVFSEKSRSLAGVKGSRIMAKYRTELKRVFMDDLGLHEKKLFGKLLELLDAKRVWMTKRGLQQFPDYLVQSRALEMLTNFLGYGDKQQQTSQTNIGQVVINKTTDDFSITDNTQVQEAEEA